MKAKALCLCFYICIKQVFPAGFTFNINLFSHNTALVRKNKVLATLILEKLMLVYIL